MMVNLSNDVGVLCREHSLCPEIRSFCERSQIQWLFGGVGLYGFLTLSESKCPITTLRNRVVFVLKQSICFRFLRFRRIDASA
ncbi:hypothetical protein, partial [Bacillus wiedmannii]|uniref:hypothetical protein n=1 Tax=Bacillus wiedmannii TaxID=1890302 RepID=UPI003CF6B07B